MIMNNVLCILYASQVYNRKSFEDIEIQDIMKEYYQIKRNLITL